MSYTDKEIEDLEDLYHSLLLDTSEAIGWAIEILTKIDHLVDNRTIKTMPIDDQEQLKQTIPMLKNCQETDERFRGHNDPPTRTYEEYNWPDGR